MPTAWSAGEHDVKQFSSSGRVMLRCKCGWELPDLGPEFFGYDEKWRNIASGHIQAENS